MQNPEITFPPTLLVTEQTIDISGFSQSQRTFYLNLFWEIVEIYRAQKKPRVIIGNAASREPGAELARQAGLPFAFESVTIDAWHYRNEYLLSHFSAGKPLKKVKGRFDTYDVRGLVADLEAFAAGKEVAFPVYSRKLHDPVKNSIHVTTAETLLVVEGLWLLHDAAGWEAVRPLLDFSFFIESDVERTKAPVIRRHMTGGRTLADATHIMKRWMHGIRLWYS